jgi:hypothetical protein
MDESQGYPNANLLSSIAIPAAFRILHDGNSPAHDRVQVLQTERVNGEYRLLADPLSSPETKESHLSRRNHPGEIAKENFRHCDFPILPPCFLEAVHRHPPSVDPEVVPLRECLSMLKLEAVLGDSSNSPSRYLQRQMLIVWAGQTELSATNY